MHRTWEGGGERNGTLAISRGEEWDLGHFSREKPLLLKKLPKYLQKSGQEIGSPPFAGEGQGLHLPVPLLIQLHWWGIELVEWVSGG